MSKTIDERVVEMRFDNKQFENNVQTTMSTLDKLKQRLNLTGASKGLENVDKAAKNVNFTGISGAVETVHAKFSALEVMGVTALANITNSAVNAGKRIASALTIEPVKTGFQEYETQINAIQTILANTESKGTTLKDVNAALDELNTYADKTIYNFTEMTRNIGTFTAAGVDLDTSVSAIQGIANLAAVSGSTSQQASTAMYQLSQALASGTVKLQDWNSVVNAGMGGEVFQNALKRTATVMGTNVDALIEKYGSFRESLTQGEWLTTDVLTETLNQFIMAAEEGTEQWEEYKKSLMDKGYTEDQANEILKMANTATDAATKVKTFSQLMDTLKESLQSGWTQTWEILLGDFEEAKELFSGISDFLGKIIDKSAKKRNKLLEGALSSSTFGKLAEKIEKVTSATDKLKNATDKVSEATKNYNKIVDKVINGDFGNRQSRWDKLTESGYDWAKVQNLVNERMGDSTRYTEQLTEAQQKQTETQTTTIDQLMEMSDAQLKSLDFTDDEIEAFRELESQSKKTGIPIKNLMKDIDQLNGRTLLINSFKNVGKSLIAIFTSIGKAWKSAFPPMQSDQLYNIIAAIHKFSTKLVISKGTAKNLTRTLKGLFAILGIITDITGGALKIGLKVISTILGYFNTDILRVTASIGDTIVAFRKAYSVIFESFIAKGIEKVTPIIAALVDGLKRLKKEFLEIPQVQKIIEKFSNALSELKNIDLSEVSKYIIDGLVNGLENGISIAVDKIIELGKRILEGICNVLGIHSPSREFFEIGTNIIQGLVNGIQNGASKVWETIKKLGSKCIEIISNIDFGKILAGVMGVGILVVSKKALDIFEAFSAPLAGIGDIFEGLGARFKADAWVKKSKAILNCAIAISILTASLVLLSKVPSNDLLKTMGVMTFLTVALMGLAKASEVMNNVKFDFGKASLSLLAVSGSLLILAIAMKKLSTIKGEDTPTILVTLTGMIFGMIAVLYAFGKFVDGDKSANMDKAGFMLLKMSVALMIMVKVIKQASSLEIGEVIKGIGVITALEFLFAGIIAISQFSGEHGAKAGSMLLLMSGALLVMIGVIKLASGLEIGEIIKGIAVVAAIELLFAGIIAVSALAGKHGAQAGVMLLGMSIALAMTVTVIKQVSRLDDSHIKKGLGVIALLEILFGAIIAVSRLAGKNGIKAGVMLLLMSGSLLILTGVLYILKEMDPSGLGRALGIISVLEILFMGLIAVSHLATDCKGTLITITLTIGLLIAAVVALSFLDPQSLGVAAAALTGVISAFALLLAATKFMNNFKSMIGPTLVLVGVVAVLAGIIVKLSNLDTGSALSSAAALSLLLITMSGALLILSNVGANAMLGVAGLAVMGLVVGELAVILGLMGKFDVNPSIEIAASLSILLTSMSASLILLGVVGLMGPAAFVGIAALAVLIAGIGGLIVGIGALATEFPKLEEFINNGIPILEQIGYGIGSFFGNIVNGFASGASEALPTIATNLSLFMLNLTPFIAGAKMIDASVVAGVGFLSASIIALTAAEFINGMASMLTLGTTSLAQLGSDLSMFMMNASGFILGVKMVDASAAEGAKALAEMILALTAANFINGISSLLSLGLGDSSLSTFGSELVPFGEAMRDFSNVLTEGNFDGDAVKAAATAGELMAKMADMIPNSGGLMGVLAGNNNISVFALELVTFGQAMVDFSNVVSEGGISEEAVNAAKRAGDIMIALANSIPNSGGLMGALAGDNNIGKFGEDIKAFGEAMVGFSDAVGEGGISEEAVNAAKSAGDIMVALANSIPKSGGLTSLFTGNDNIEKFGEDVVAFGQAMVDFSDVVTENPPDVSAISTAVDAGTQMALLANIIPKSNIFTGEGNLKNFSGTLKKFGEGMADFSKEAEDIKTGSINNATTSVNKLTTMLNNISKVDTSGVTAFKTAISSLSKINMTEFTKTFSNTSSLSSVGTSMINSITKGITSKQSSLSNIGTTVITTLNKAITSKVDVFNKTGIALMNALIKGISSNDSKLKSAITKSLSDAVTGARGYYDNFYSAGSYLVSGFANGISENTYKATAKAVAMAKASEEAARKQLNINSPSKVFRKIGMSVPEGFAMGIDRLGSMVTDSSENMGKKAIKSVGNSIARLSEMVDGNIDAQPTIRPVVDLSNVQSGASAINDIFSKNSSIRVLSRVGSINAMMNGRQNGNDDVVTAINKLRKDLGNVGGTTYSINGITYDDGSNVSEAFKTIVRAAKIERRI